MLTDVVPVAVAATFVGAAGAAPHCVEIDFDVVIEQELAFVIVGVTTVVAAFGVNEIDDDVVLP